MVARVSVWHLHSALPHLYPYTRERVHMAGERKERTKKSLLFDSSVISGDALQSQVYLTFLLAAESSLELGVPSPARVPAPTVAPQGDS